MATIEVRRVSYRAPGGRRVLEDCSLAVELGEVLALVGRSGAGKTTILKLVNRLLVPESGTVTVLGHETQRWDPIRLRRSIGYVVQEVGLFPHMSVADNIALVPRLEKWDAARVDKRVFELLELIQLAPADYAGRWPDQLSGGERQRVGVARALGADPPVLLMDEPFGALDPITRRELQHEFGRIQARVRKAVILVTHDMSEALALGDRIGVVDDGMLAWCDRPDRIFDSDDPRVRRLLEGLAPRADRAEGR